MSHTNHFSKAFRKVRRARGLTQEDFAEGSGRTYISELERAVKHPTLNKIDELAQPLDVHPLTVLALSYATTDSVGAIDKLLAQVRKEVVAILEATADE